MIAHLVRLRVCLDALTKQPCGACVVQQPEMMNLWLPSQVLTTLKMRSASLLSLAHSIKGLTNQTSHSQLPLSSGTTAQLYLLCCQLASRLSHLRQLLLQLQSLTVFSSLIIILLIRPRSYRAW